VTILGGAVVPAAPLGLSVVTPRAWPDDQRDIDKLRAMTTAALSALPPDGPVIVLAPGTAVGLGSLASLAGLGVAWSEDVPTDDEVARLIARSTGIPTTEAPLLLGHAVLASHVSAAHPGRRVVAVGVSRTADGGDLLDVGAAIAAALGDRPAVVVAAGDLSAGIDDRSPAWRVDGAAAWVNTVVRGVRPGAPLDRALARAGPDEASRVRATGWAPLTALAGIPGLVVSAAHQLAVRGVAHLIAVLEAP